MRGRMVLRTIRLGGWDPGLVRLLLLALAFLGGALAGHLYAGSCGQEAWEALGQYLGDYCRLYDGGGIEISLLSCVVMYFGYAVLLFLLGFSAAGVVLIPALSGMFGFFTMYTVSCFVRCYGRAGAALALGAMVVRLGFTLPCFFRYSSFLASLDSSPCHAFSCWRVRRGRCPRSCSPCPSDGGSARPPCCMEAVIFCGSCCVAWSWRWAYSASGC